MAPYFEEVFTAQRCITWNVLDDILQRDNMEEINCEIEFEELLKALKKLANKKSPGLNNVLPDAFKALSH